MFKSTHFFFFVALLVAGFFFTATAQDISVNPNPGPVEPELQLRGCIGDILPRAPLYKSVIVNAINASFKDRRFVPLRMEEYDEIVIEISALTTPQPIEGPNSIRIGIDGVILRKDGRSAVYLPQVAPEQGWDVSEMLTHLSRKAGLPSDAWRQGTQFLVFQAEVFGEEK